VASMAAMAALGLPLAVSEAQQARPLLPGASSEALGRSSLGARCSPRGVAPLRPLAPRATLSLPGPWAPAGGGAQPGARRPLRPAPPGAPGGCRGSGGGGLHPQLPCGGPLRGRGILPGPGAPGRRDQGRGPQRHHPRAGVRRGAPWSCPSPACFAPCGLRVLPADPCQCSGCPTCCWQPDHYPRSLARTLLGAGPWGSVPDRRGCCA